MGINKKLIITNEKDFSKALKSGRKYVTYLFVMFSIPTTSKTNNPKFGIIASKKIGNAVERNRSKRLIKESIRLHLEKFAVDNNYVFICRSALIKVKIDSVRNEFNKMFSVINKHPKNS